MVKCTLFKERASVRLRAGAVYIFVKRTRSIALISIEHHEFENKSPARSLLAKVWFASAPRGSLNIATIIED